MYCSLTLNPVLSDKERERQTDTEERKVRLRTRGDSVVWRLLLFQGQGHFERIGKQFTRRECRLSSLLLSSISLALKVFTFVRW